ncbi:hypothetical protein T492DRAFT_1060072 [Pavlovales sp. CCMP2436]|nr:hypothetical protein T492DRAFT_1060072 [Pavlovales sp. CCMP2436]
MKLAILALLCVGAGAFELLAPARASTSVRALAPRRARALPGQPAQAIAMDAAAWQLAVSALVGTTVPLLMMASSSELLVNATEALATATARAESAEATLINYEAELNSARERADEVDKARAVDAQNAETALVELRAQLAQAIKQLGRMVELVNKLRAHIEMRAAVGEAAAAAAGDDPNRKSSAAPPLPKPVRGRKRGTEDEWRHFESCSAAARELGLDRVAIKRVANGIRTQVGGWTFEDTQQSEDIAGEV